MGTPQPAELDRGNGGDYPPPDGPPPDYDAGERKEVGEEKEKPKM